MNSAGTAARRHAGPRVGDHQVIAAPPASITTGAAVGEAVLHQAGHDQLQPAGVGQHRQTFGDLVSRRTGHEGGQGGVNGPGDVGRPQGQSKRVALAPGHLVGSSATRLIRSAWRRIEAPVRRMRSVESSSA